jgi:hypothetical protein
MSSVAVKENLHKPYINSSYQDVMKEIKLQTEERTRLVEFRLDIKKPPFGGFLLTPIQVQSATFIPKKEQDTVGIIYSFLGLVKRSTNEPIQASYPRAKIPYLPVFKARNDAIIHC